MSVNAKSNRHTEAIVEMRRFSPGRYIRNLLIFFLPVVGFAAVCSGSSSIGGFSFWEGLSVVGSMFGGITSFGALLGVIVSIVIVVFGLRHIAKTDYTNQGGLMAVHIGLAALAIVAAAWIGLEWVSLPGWEGWVAAGILVVFLVCPLLLQDTFKKIFVPVPAATPDTYTS
jgi:hypothetical protein